MARPPGLGLNFKFVSWLVCAVAAVSCNSAGIVPSAAPTVAPEFTDLSLSTKVFEYAAMGKSVVATRLPMVERTFPSGTVTTYAPGDPASMASAIASVADDEQAREAAIERTTAIVRGAAWEHESVRYLALLEELIRGRPGRADAPHGRSDADR